MAVVTAVEHLCPPAGLSGNWLVDSGPPVHATRDDLGAIRADRKAQNILAVALNSLRLGVGLAVPDAHLASRVARDNVPVGQTLDRPNNNVLGTSINIRSERHLSEERATSNVVGANRTVRASHNDDISGLEVNANKLDVFGRRSHQGLFEIEVVILE